MLLLHNQEVEETTFRFMAGNDVFKSGVTSVDAAELQSSQTRGYLLKGSWAPREESSPALSRTNRSLSPFKQSCGLGQLIHVNSPTRWMTRTGWRDGSSGSSLNSLSHSQPSHKQDAANQTSFVQILGINKSKLNTWKPEHFQLFHVSGVTKIWMT